MSEKPESDEFEEEDTEDTAPVTMSTWITLCAT